jgi:hypothetical protein
MFFRSDPFVACQKFAITLLELGLPLGSDYSWNSTRLDRLTHRFSSHGPPQLRQRGLVGFDVQPPSLVFEFPIVTMPKQRPSSLQPATAEIYVYISFCIATLDNFIRAQIPNHSSITGFVGEIRKRPIRGNWMDSYLPPGSGKFGHLEKSEPLISFNSKFKLASAFVDDE